MEKVINKCIQQVRKYYNLYILIYQAAGTLLSQGREFSNLADHVTYLVENGEQISQFPMHVPAHCHLMSWVLCRHPCDVWHFFEHFAHLMQDFQYIASV